MKQEIAIRNEKLEMRNCGMRFAHDKIKNQHRRRGCSADPFIAFCVRKPYLMRPMPQIVNCPLPEIDTFSSPEVF